MIVHNRVRVQVSYTSALDVHECMFRAKECTTRHVSCTLTRAVQECTLRSRVHVAFKSARGVQECTC